MSSPCYVRHVLLTVAVSQTERKKLADLKTKGLYDELITMADALIAAGKAIASPVVESKEGA